MRVTTSFPLGTLRDTPSEAEIISHQLLLKAGYIKRINSGIYAYMPIMLRVIEKISALIAVIKSTNIFVLYSNSEAKEVCKNFL